MKYRKKPIVVEAIKFDGSNGDEIIRWAHKDLPKEANSIITLWPRPSLNIRTLEGGMTASPGDWVIKGIKGEFYPCKPDIFEATYEKVGEEKLMGIKEAVCVLCEELRKDSAYRFAWKSNIAMQFIDMVHRYSYDFPDLNKIANAAAEEFLILLTEERKPLTQKDILDQRG